jgi:transcription-repair coupling factor (superfamily II helicase)
VATLLDVARLRSTARRVGLKDITLQGSYVRFAPVTLADSRVVRVQRLYPKTLLKPTVSTMLVPVPKAGASSGGFGGEPLRDTALLGWCTEVLRSVLSES